MHDVAVIGAGVIGSVCAAYLAEAGFGVTLIEREPQTLGTSYGNAAALAAAEIFPLAMPGVLSRVPRWLMDPDGPLYLDPRHAVRSLPWLLRFAWNTRRAQAERATAAMAALCAAAAADYEEFLDRIDEPDLLVRNGALRLYRSRRAFDADAGKWQARAGHGVRFDVLDGPGIQALEPAVDAGFETAALVHGHHYFRDPWRVVTAAREQVCASGGQLLHGTVVRVGSGERHAVDIELADGRRLHAARIVLANGAWAGQLAQQLGCPIPLDTERGYHAQFARPGVTLSRSVGYVEGAMSLAPLERGLRVAGTVELAGLEAPPNFKRAAVLARKIKEVIPRLDISEPDFWMGYRPTVPDSLPIIGHSPRDPRVLFALAHGHMGLTLAATTARLIRCLARGERPDVDLAPFAITRFARW